MADVFSKEIRSKIMSRIRGKDTLPEMLVRSFLHKNGFRYRLHVKNLPGKPDIVLPKYHTIILIHGCFWHGHNPNACRVSTSPKSNKTFWKEKVLKNKHRDKKNEFQLRKQGWRVLIVWGCQLRGKPRDSTLRKIVDKILTKPS